MGAAFKEVRSLSKNVTIVVIVLILVVIAGYLVWLRGQYQPPAAPRVETPPPSPSPTVTPGPEATKAATPAATPKGTKTGTPSSGAR